MKNSGSPLRLSNHIFWAIAVLMVLGFALGAYMIVSERIHRRSAFEQHVKRELVHLLEIAEAVQGKGEFLSQTKEGISAFRLSREADNCLVYVAEDGGRSQYTLALFFAKRNGGHVDAPEQ